MFDDLIIPKIKKFTDNILTLKCVICNHEKVMHYGSGIFISQCKFKQPIMCIFCGHIWHIIYDDNLKIIGVME